MKVYMEPKHKFGKTTLDFWGYEDYSGILKSNPFRHVDVALYRGGESIFGMRQTNLWALVLLFPVHLIGRCDSPSYHVFYKGYDIGSSVWTWNSNQYEFSIKGYTYILRRHSHNIGSLTKSGRQIARYEWSWKNPVEIEFASQHDLEIVLTFGIFFYAVFHAHREMWHDTILFHDKYKHLAHWKSPDSR